MFCCCLNKGSFCFIEQWIVCITVVIKRMQMAPTELFLLWKIAYYERTSAFGKLLVTKLLGVKTRSRGKSEPTVSFRTVDAYYKGKDIKTIDFM